MAKFHGSIAYIRTEETSPGVFEEVVTERAYTGDIIRNSRRYEGGQNMNETLTINNRFSVIADQFAFSNFPYMRYLTWNGTKWEIASFEIDHPRVIITVGGVYNG